MIAKLFLFLIVLALSLIYWDSFSSGFFQDDFLLLKLSRIGNIFEIIPNFPYRPISIQVFYSISDALFSGNPFGFHLLQFLLFSLSLIFVYQVAKRITLSARAAALTTFIYSFNISLFALFYWVATSYFVLAALFIFSGIHFFFKNSKKAFLFSLILFVLGLLSNEIVIVFPGLLGLVGLLIKKIKWKKLGLVALIDLIFLISRVLFFSMPTANDYKLDFSLRFLATFKWYFLRIFNLPEGVDRQGVAPIILASVLLFLIFLMLVKLVKNHSFPLKLLIFSGAWFFLGALPFYFLPGHMSSYYLTISLFGPSVFLAKVLIPGKVTLLLFMTIYLYMTITGLIFLRQTHWIIQKPINDNILNSYDNWH